MPTSTSPFVARYLEHCGTSEVPAQYHIWTATTLLAATAANRVWVQKGAARLLPNLYTFLVGPSGSGKDSACNTMFRLIDGLGIEAVRSRMTAAAIIDRMSIKPTAAPKGAPAPAPPGRFFFVTPELAASVNRGPLAEETLKLMTALYSDGDVSAFAEQTRMHGSHVIREWCINWLAGSTKEWLRDIITTDVIESGFFARACFIVVEYDPNLRVAWPTLPANHATLVTQLRTHLQTVQQLSGPLVLAAKAQRILDEWYLQRPAPTDTMMLSAWRREHDLLIKLSMLQALGDGPTMTIGADHIITAQRMMHEAVRMRPALTDYIMTAGDGAGLRRVRDAIQSAGVIRHGMLARQAARFGITNDRLKLYLETLLDSRLIQRTSDQRAYVWNTRRILRSPALQEDLHHDERL